MKQLFFVGYNKESLIESLRTLKEYPTDNVILIVGERNGENIPKKIAKEVMENELKLWNVEIVEIDKENIVNATFQLIRIIENMQSKEDTILNISGSLRTFAVAAYMAACITGSRLISSIPQYGDKGDEIGVKGFVEIPVLPVDFPTDEQIEIISAIGDGVDSLDELVSRLLPSKRGGGYITRYKVPKLERSRVSHHLSKIEARGLIRKTKVGRNVRIELTAIGRMFAELKRYDSY